MADRAQVAAQAGIARTALTALAPTGFGTAATVLATAGRFVGRSLFGDDRPRGLALRAANEAAAVAAGFPPSRFAQSSTITQDVQVADAFRRLDPLVTSNVPPERDPDGRIARFSTSRFGGVSPDPFLFELARARALQLGGDVQTAVSDVVRLRMGQDVISAERQRASLESLRALDAQEMMTAPPPAALPMSVPQPMEQPMADFLAPSLSFLTGAGKALSSAVQSAGGIANRFSGLLTSGGIQSTFERLGGLVNVAAAVPQTIQNIARAFGRGSEREIARELAMMPMEPMTMMEMGVGKQAPDAPGGQEMMMLEAGLAPGGAILQRAAGAGGRILLETAFDLFTRQPGREFQVADAGAMQGNGGVTGVDLVRRQVANTLFRPTMAGAAPRSVIVVPNPVTGNPTYFGNLGQPLGFTRDLRAVKRLGGIARRAGFTKRR